MCLFIYVLCKDNCIYIYMNLLDPGIIDKLVGIQNNYDMAKEDETMVYFVM